MLINVNQLNVLKKARDKAEIEDKELFNALSFAIIRLENHKCPSIVNSNQLQEQKNNGDYWDSLEGKETQKERFGK